MPFLYTIASGSSGNAAVLSDGTTHLLIDAGVSCRQITEGLRAFDLTPADLSAILITHEHSDHVRGLEVLCKRTGATVYASAGTAGSIGWRMPNLHSVPICPFEAGESFAVGDIAVTSVSTPHDTRDSVGYLFDICGTRLAFMTDLGYVPTHVMEAVRGVDCLFIESNHDLVSLVGGPYPERLKHRIMGRRGHLSNEDCSDLAVEAAQHGVRRISLCHLSRENNTPALALGQTAAALAAIQADEVELDVAAPYSVGTPFLF